MPNPKAHTFWNLFNGSGAPPSPWTQQFAGGGSNPTMSNGVLHFPTVALGGDSSGIDAVVGLDLQHDALFMQFASLIGYRGFVEWDIFFTGGYSITWQFGGPEPLISVLHGATEVTHVTPPPPAFSPLCVEIANDPHFTDVLQYNWGPTPDQMIQVTQDNGVPFATLPDITEISVYSKNTGTFSVTYGETQLIGFDAWNNTLFVRPDAPIPPITLIGGTTFSGLTGHGSLALDSNTVAVRVNLTTLPSFYGRTLTSPDVLFDIGWIAFQHGTQTESRQWVTYQDWIGFAEPNTRPQHLVWNFNPEIEAEIVCLVVS